MEIIQLEVNKKVKKANGEAEYQSLGKVEVPCFNLADFGLNVEATGKNDEGVPTYGNDKIDFVMNAVWAATKADARNKLVSGTINLKAGAKIASTVEELIAKADSGAALALHREFQTAFTAYLTTSGKSAAVQALYAGLVKSKNSVMLASEAVRKGLTVQLEAFITKASTEEAEKFANILEGLAEACQGTEALDEADL